MRYALRFFVILAVVLQPALLMAQQAQTVVTVTPNSNQQADQFSHVKIATQTGNSSVTFPIANGMTSHQLTYNVDPSVTAITVTVYAATNAGSFGSVGSSTALGGTITWTGTYNFGRVTITGFTGSGSATSDYYGASSAVPAAGSPAIPVTVSGVSVTECPSTLPCYVNLAASSLVTALPTMDTSGAALTIYAGTLSTIGDLTTTSGSGGANITTNTVTINSLHCFNRTSSAATITRADSQGTVYQSGFSIPANSDLYVVSPNAMEKQAGLAMWAGTNSAIRCVMDARQ